MLPGFTMDAFTHSTSLPESLSLLFLAPRNLSPYYLQAPHTTLHLASRYIPTPSLPLLSLTRLHHKLTSYHPPHPANIHVRTLHRHLPSNRHSICTAQPSQLTRDPTTYRKATCPYLPTPPTLSPTSLVESRNLREDIKPLICTSLSCA